MHSLRMWCKILCQNLVVHPKYTLGGSTNSIHVYVEGGWGGGQFTEFDVEFKFAKIQNSYVEGGGRGRFAEFDVEFKFAKIQNSYVEGGAGEGGGWFTEFDVEFKFAKIQNSYVEGGWVGGGLWNLMLSSNLLKSKIPMLRVGGWGGSWNLMLSSNLLKSKIPMLRVGGGGFAEYDVELKFA